MNSPPQQLDGIFQFPGEENSGHETAITIDAAYLQERPFLTNTSWYTDLGRKTSSLTLNAIDETDAESILPLFTALQHLSLQKITIMNKQFRGLPNKGIESLQLVDCKITENVAWPWFFSFDKSLLNVEIARCYHGVKGSFVDLLQGLPDSVRSLSVYDPICTSIRIGKLPTSLTYLHLELPRERSHRLIVTITKCAPELTTLILKMPKIESWSIEMLQELKNLQHLRILNSVDIMGLSLLQSLGNLKTLDVHCYAPPEKENQILELNDDCLLHVFSFLEQMEWIALSQAHSRFDTLVTTYIYPREQIAVHTGGVYGDFSDAVKMEILMSLQKYATSIQVLGLVRSLSKLTLSDFENLHTLTFSSRVSAACIQTIPSGIKKLRLHSKDSVGKVHQLSDLFHRLSPSLTSLNLIGDFNPNDLCKLTNLRELKVEDWTKADLIGILRRSEDHLESLTVYFSIEHALVESRFPLCPLDRLKVLHLNHINCRIDLKPSDLPSLEELQLTFFSRDDSRELDMLKSIAKFVQLKSLSVQRISFAELFQLKNLEYLEYYEYLEYFKYAACWDRNMKSRHILEIFKQLPKLTKMKWVIDLDSETEVQLRTFLITEKRTLKLYRFHEMVVLP